MERKEACERLLRDLKLISTIPHLGYKEQPNTMECVLYLRGLKEAVSDGLEYLEVINRERKSYEPEE